MAALNYVGSGMLRVDETYNETQEQTKKRLKQYEADQCARTSFQIGAVTHLKTSPYRQGMESVNCDESVDGSSETTDQNIQKHMPQPYLIPAYVKNSREAFISKNAVGKMKLVELYQYSGFNVDQSTSLPNDVTTMSILMKVISAQARQYNEAYRQEFDQLFLSAQSLAIMQDMFWWTFVNNWEPNAGCQSKLLSRVSASYASLRLKAETAFHRDRFYRDYPMLVSQAVYAAFCECFIDSYPQFGEQFKELVIRILHEWLTGVRPAARLWVKWNFAKLEPEEITARKKILQTSERRKSTLAETALIHFPSDESDFPAVPALSSRLASRQSRPVQSSQSILMPANSDVNTVSVAGRTLVTQGSTSVSANVHQEKRKKSSMFRSMSSGVNPELSESHPVGKGPTYTNTAFNVHGHSPATAHYLASNNVHSNAGLDLLVSRTEVENLPPLDAETYKEIIRESFKTIRRIDERYKEFYEQSTREGVEFSRKLGREQNSFKQKEEALLKKPREVHTLSELLSRKHKRGGSELSKATQHAVDSALANV